MKYDYIIKIPTTLEIEVEAEDHNEALEKARDIILSSTLYAGGYETNALSGENFPGSLYINDFEDVEDVITISLNEDSLMEKFEDK
jgi:hypothetical protein